MAEDEKTEVEDQPDEQPEEPKPPPNKGYATGTMQRTPE